MDKKPFDYLIYIGRFQPFHNGHRDIIDQSLSQCDKLILLVGSATSSISPRNPFTYDQRKEMIETLYGYDVHHKKIIIVPIKDYLYNDTSWISHVRNVIEDTIRENPVDKPNGNVGLTGYNKDGTSYYLKKFPHLKNHVQINPTYRFINSTSIRDSYFSGTFDLPYHFAPKNIVTWMEKFRHTDQFAVLCEEMQFINDYKKKYNAPVYLTSDAVVVQSGHILLVERGQMPGRGKLALPGGFLNEGETLEACAARELYEETAISDDHGRIPKGKLKSFIVKSKTFDDPHRSQRGRIVTNAYTFQLPETENLYTIKGGDDAKRAFWQPIAHLNESEMFEDHFHIIRSMLNISI